MTGDYVAAAYRRYEQTTPGTPEAVEAVNEYLHALREAGGRVKDDFDWIVTQLREAEKDDGWPPWAVLGVWLLMAAATFGVWLLLILAVRAVMR